MEVIFEGGIGVIGDSVMHKDLLTRGQGSGTSKLILGCWHAVRRHTELDLDALITDTSFDNIVTHVSTKDVG